MENTNFKANNWKNSNIQVFWGEIAPSDHLVQIYENEGHFLNTLEGFAGSGILSGDSVVIIAKQSHLDQLQQRLINHNFDLASLMKNDLYIPLEANDILAKFMVNSWPDEKLFNDVVSAILKRARKNDRKVRAFGEMVAILWEQGNNGATVRLENLWHNLHSMDNFSIYCAYPKSGFTRNYADSISEICKAHSKIIDGENRPSTEIYWSEVGV
ncbi:DcmR-like sensory protein [Flavobacterium chryseum]|uniref:MEDS domain-containing protein n=1 Tax=Flavobacterium sp. P3160 TaxID=2512113 RepID=UPI0010DD5F85|nr:MEDS domain-containing protein [Flavobacterium sp. P3160]TDO71152.1 DcmR-like sensory protein [Flavobacterium sp. P3160]